MSIGPSVPFIAECLANADEAIGEAYLSEAPLSVEQLKAGIRRATLAHRFTPVLVGTALRNRGVQPLMDAVVDYLPNPMEIKHYALHEKEGCVCVVFFLSYFYYL